MSDKFLTVVITTYNRKESLITALKSFEIQGSFDQYELIISNNCSDYNVNEWLELNLSKNFLEIITIYNRPYNVGGDINISFTFQLCKTKWMWLMSDDDKALPNSLSIVLSDIERFKDVAHIKYSIKDFDKLPDKYCNRFGEVLDAFITPEFKAGYGQFVFMSNNVINLDKVNTFIGLAPYHAHTCITQLIPSIFSLCKANSTWRLSSDSLTNYEPDNASYSRIYAYINFINIQLIDADLSRSEILKIRKLFSLNGRRNIANELLAIQPCIKSRQLFYRYWTGYYSILSLRGFIFFAYYNIKMLIINHHKSIS